MLKSIDLLNNTDAQANCNCEAFIFAHKGKGQETCSWIINAAHIY